MNAKPSSASATIRFNSLAGVATVIVAIVEAMLATLADPAVSAMLTKALPAEHRALAYVFLAAFIAEWNRRRRYKTSQPIIKRKQKARDA